jgi:hypothetical protein
MLEAADGEIAARAEMQRLAEEEARLAEEEARRVQEEARLAEQHRIVEARMSKARAEVESWASQQRAADQELRGAEQAVEVLGAALAAARAEAASAEASMSAGLQQLSVAQHAARRAAAAVGCGPLLMRAAEAGEEELAAALATASAAARDVLLATASDRVGGERPLTHPQLAPQPAPQPQPQPQPPAAPPPPTGPVVFEGADECHVCGAAFSFFARRHHCRECGRSVCYDHSRRTQALAHREPQMPGLKLRVCDGCDERLAAARRQWEAAVDRGELLGLLWLPAGAPPAAVRAALNKPNQGGDLPIHNALRAAAPGPELVRAMLDAGGDAMLGVPGWHKCLPLHYAACHSPFPAVVALLLARGPAAALLAKTEDGITPLACAAQGNTGPGAEEIVALLRAAIGYTPAYIT